jgi:nitroreductase
MDINTLLKQRHSVRAFTNQPVEQELLKQIFSASQLSPSNCNVQPWHTYVVSGEAKQQLKKSLIELLMQGAQPNPEFDWIPKYQDIHRERQFGSANALYSSVNISREDKQARQMSMLRNWQFFDAPHVVFFTMEKYLGIMGAVDMGIYAQTLNLLLAENGISSCMQGALGQFPEPIKQQLGIDDSKGILFGMSIGYEDTKAKVNNTRTDRASLDDSVEFIC